MKKTKTTTTTNKDPKVPEFAPVIEGYLAGMYAPMDWRRPGEGPTETRWIVRSSQEIILELADMADISLNDVAAAMLWLGYRVAQHEGKTGWLMKVL